MNAPRVDYHGQCHPDHGHPANARSRPSGSRQPWSTLASVIPEAVRIQSDRPKFTYDRDQVLAGDADKLFPSWGLLEDTVLI